MPNIIFREESYKIIGACFEVYKNKGCGFSEAIYQECLALEFGLQEIPFLAQPTFELDYKGTKLVQFFRADFVCYGAILVELKSLPKLTDSCRSQALNYLNATRNRLCLLVNFGHHPRLEYERIVL
ncbi:MAG: GxxExxY protein [Acidobacteria bacterium]|nr:GxxExxY protein [Acidobacteriota bacterium]